MEFRCLGKSWDSCMACLGPSRICGRAGQIQVLGKGKVGKVPISLASEGSTTSPHLPPLIHPWRQAREELESQHEEQRAASRRTSQTAVRQWGR